MEQHAKDKARELRNILGKGLRVAKREETRWKVVCIKHLSSDRPMPFENWTMANEARSTYIALVIDLEKAYANAVRIASLADRS